MRIHKQIKLICLWILLLDILDEVVHLYYIDSKDRLNSIDLRVACRRAVSDCVSTQEKGMGEGRI
jgi:hypothetical protein